MPNLRQILSDPNSLRGRVLMGAVLGLVFALGQAPFHQWAIAVLGLAGLFWGAARCVSPKSGFWFGWGFGLGYFGLSLSWIIEPFLVDIATHGWMAPFALLFMAGGLALFWGGAVWAAIRLNTPWALIATLTLAEVLRAFVFTGFPWGLIGYVWVASPVISLVAWVGPFGLTLLTCAVGYGVARLMRNAPPVALAPVAIAAVALQFVTPYFETSPTPPAQDAPVVRLIQPNAAQHEKWRQDKIPMFFRRQVAFSAEKPQPDLIVWPETSLPMLLRYADEALGIIERDAGRVPTVLGVQRGDSDGYYNSLLVTGVDDQPDQLYDKHHLVPFGEYMPLAPLFERIGIFGLAARARGGYAAGQGPQIVDLGPKIGTALPLICYEAVFPQNVRGTDTRPAMLLQITNDAWFGQYSGPFQHLDQARIRAIEQGLPLIRAANTGVSAVIDGKGHITAKLDLGIAGFVDAPLPRALDATIYSRSGDLPSYIVLLTLLLASILTQARNRD